MREKLEELLALVSKEEDKYYAFAGEEMEKNNMVGNMVMIAQATAYQRVRYTIENMLENLN